MNAPQDTPEAQGDTYRADVDEQDGGPGSHPEDDSGGSVNDVASGGVSERRNEDDDTEDDDYTDDNTDDADVPDRGGSDAYDGGETDG